MQSLIECIPNFSEGRDPAKVEAIVQAILAGPDVFLLDKEMDADHNRCVITFVGTRESVGEAALRGIGRAADLIDLTRHQGAHPRIGATDVVPFVPVAGVTLEECVHIAEQVAAETWRRFRIPTYLYEAAARSPERTNLENIRRGQFEGLRSEISSNPVRKPDFGEHRLHPTAGATVLGARKFLIAYNINLKSADLNLAKAIARKVRTSGGGLPCVKAMGVPLKSSGQIQVSMNLTDFETTSMADVFGAVGREAVAAGVEVVGSEIIGLVPQKAVDQAAGHFLKIYNFQADSIFENRLARIIEEQQGARGGDGNGLSGLVARFVEAVAGPTATPGGGSVSAFAGALAAALGEMVCGITLKRKSFEQHRDTLENHLKELLELRGRLLRNIDRDARAFESVLAAMKLPARTADEIGGRRDALGRASQSAAEVPLESAELANRVARVLKSLRPVTSSQLSSDLAVALRLARAAQEGAVENVRVNLPTLSEEAIKQIEQRLGQFEEARE